MLRSAAPAGQMGARMIHQNAAHHLSRYSEKVGAILPGDFTLANQPQVRLMDNRSRLQRMIDALAAHVSGRQTVKLIVDAVHQFRGRPGVVMFHLSEQFSDLRHAGFCPRKMVRFYSKCSFFAMSVALLPQWRGGGAHWRSKVVFRVTNF